jgi:hypothetical protein
MYVRNPAILDTLIKMNPNGFEVGLVEEVGAEISRSMADSSHHPRTPVRAGLVRSRREGTRINYRLAGPQVENLWVALPEAFSAFLGERTTALPVQTASEDFSDILQALGGPYCSWGVGGTDPDTHHKAGQAGRIAQNIPVDHSAYSAPVTKPALDTGIQAMGVAALVWLASPPTSGV